MREIPTGRAFMAGVQCDRCGQHHASVHFTPFMAKELRGSTHWGICPVTEEPILAEVKAEDSESVKPVNKYPKNVDK